MVKRQPSWDKYEAAILLEGFLASMKGELTRSNAIKSVSRDLKAMALNRGMDINDVYRNANGISFQMKSMESGHISVIQFSNQLPSFLQMLQLYIIDLTMSTKIY